MAPSDSDADVTADLEELRADWTPKQHENWESHGEPVFDRIETDAAREMYLRTWRPKMRNDGLMERDHVELGTEEHYVSTELESALKPMGSIHASVMAGMFIDSDRKDDLDDIVDDILRARVEHMNDQHPARAKRLLKQSQRAAELYGVA